MPIILYLVFGLVLGLVLGWLARAARGGRSPGDLRVEEELRQNLQRRESELAENRRELDRANDERAAAQALHTAHAQQLVHAQADLETLRARVSAVENERATLTASLGAAEKLRAEEKEWHARSLAEAKSAQEKSLADLREAFQALSAEALKQTQPEFLRLAHETLGKYQESARGDLAQRQQAIATLVEPLKQQLEVYQQRLQQSERAQFATLGEVKQQLEGLAKNSQTLSSETLQLRRVLSSNQARGRWGEETLRRVIEAAGMSSHCDFTEQQMAGESKPDLTVHLPGNRVILVDAKVPDLDFLDALDAADPVKRAEALAAHAGKLRGTIRALADRNYPSQFPNALDHVGLFLPAESLFSAALEGDRELIVWAAQKRILLATPASLIALLRSVSLSWQQHAQTENAQAIVAAAQEFYARVCRFTEHFERIRSGLDRANSAYNDAVGSFERMVRPAGEKLADLGGAVAGKELAVLPPLEAPLRAAPAIVPQNNPPLATGTSPLAH